LLANWPWGLLYIVRSYLLAKNGPLIYGGTFVWDTAKISGAIFLAVVELHLTILAGD